MLQLCFVINVGIVFSAAGIVQNRTSHFEVKNFKDATFSKSFILPNTNHETNLTYFDKEENIVRIPNKIYENTHKKPKLIKAPRRTIQKIIRKGKSKTKKIYVRPMTRKPTIEVEQVAVDEYSQEDVTTEVNRKRKPKKNPKTFRNQMLHKFQSHKRNKRDTSRELYILKDFDEIEFVSSKNDYNVINSHVKKYW